MKVSAKWQLSLATLLALSVLMHADAGRSQQPRITIPPPIILNPDAVVVRVYESTLNRLADAVGPLTYTGHYTFSVTVCVPLTNLCGSTQICDSDWTATVRQLRFAITPAAINITGTVDASWCGVSFGSELKTTADVVLQTGIVFVPGTAHVALPPQESLVLTVSPTSIQPEFDVQGYTVKLPIHINVAPALALPPIPLSPALVSINTATGLAQLHLSPSQVAVVKRDHCVELQSTMQLW
jgi:hypothetical protein